MQRIIFMFFVFLCTFLPFSVEAKSRYQKEGNITCLKVMQETYSEVTHYSETKYCTFALTVLDNNCTSVIEYSETDQALPTEAKHLEYGLVGVYADLQCEFYTNKSLAFDGDQKQFETLLEGCVSLEALAKTKIVGASFKKCKEKIKTDIANLYYSRNKQKLHPDTINALLGRRPIAPTKSGTIVNFYHLILMIIMVVFY